MQQQLQVFDLFRRHSNNHPSEGNEADQSGSLQYRLPRNVGLIDMHERISRKQWSRHHLLPVTPGVVFGQQWKVDFAAFVVELRHDSFLEPVSSLHREPLRWQWGHYRWLRLRFQPADDDRRRDSIATAH